MKVGRPTSSGYVPDELVDTERLAGLVGLGHKSVYVYHSRGVLPEPACVLGRTPLWWKSDIVEWDRNR